MKADILTMIWKEQRTLFRQKGSRSRYLLMLLSPLVLATVFPITWGPDWVKELPMLVLAVLVPVMTVGVAVPDSFAGERERHTLETLLSSRLPDRAILFGKLITPVVVGWALTLVLMVVSLIVVNIAHGQGELLLYTTPIGLGGAVLSLLVALATAAGGVLISLRAATAQEASQKLMAFLLVPAIVVQVVPLLFRDSIGSVIDAINGPQLLLAVLVALVIIDLVLMTAAIFRFQRARLALD